MPAKELVGGKKWKKHGATGQISLHTLSGKMVKGTQDRERRKMSSWERHKGDLVNLRSSGSGNLLKGENLKKILCPQVLWNIIILSAVCALKIRRSAVYSINISAGDDTRRKKLTAAACGAAVWRPAVMSHGVSLSGDEMREGGGLRVIAGNYGKFDPEKRKEDLPQLRREKEQEEEQEGRSC